MWCVERAGPDRWSRRQSLLQSGNLVVQLPVLSPALLDHPQQMIYQGVRCFRGTSTSATLIGLAPSMPHRKHQNHPPGKDQFHGVIEKPTSTLLMFCHEGPWNHLDRIWLVHTDGSGLKSIHVQRAE